MKFEKLKRKFVFKKFKTDFFRWWQLRKLDDSFYDELIETIIKEYKND
jgi:hypothetical protein